MTEDSNHFSRRRLESSPSLPEQGGCLCDHPWKTTGLGAGVLSNPGRLALALVLGIALWLAARPVLAAVEEGGDIDWWGMAMQLFGGLAVFLFGMEQMAEALKRVAGHRMKAILGKLTTSRIMGLLTGAFVTAIIQSSSVTTVMLVGFVTAGLMSLSQAIGVILGADIGTTVTAQIVAFKVTRYALLLVAVGFLLIFTGKAESTKHYGALIMGLGLIFFGMGIMSAGMKPLRSYEPFIHLMQNVSNPAIGILIATVFTALVQSSSATMGVVIALASQGLISLEGGIALALGANIGTCATAGLAALGKPREAVRVAVAHVMFKIVGVLLIVWFIPPFADLIRSISPTSDSLTGFDKLAAETPRQVANAHTVFNVGIALLFLPMAPLFARFCEWVVPDRPIVEPAVIQPKYLDAELLSTPALALDRARREIGRLGELVEAMLKASVPTVVSGNKEQLQTLAEMDADIDVLHGHIVRYLSRLSGHELSAEEADEVMNLLLVANNLEAAGDIMETNLVTIGRRRIDEEVVVSAPTRTVIERYQDEVVEALRAAIKAIREEDREAALKVKAMKKGMAELAEETAKHEIDRLVTNEPNRLQTFTREMEIIENLSRIYRLCRKIAKVQWLQASAPELREPAE
ncbi:MAG: Na/Pi cotransporter family protein [Kiloniellales bacterium]|nr:Na/Pi cotransporter family protein [Kiloniellales bacterium]